MKEIPEEVLAKVLVAIRDEQGQRKQLADDPRLLIAGFSTPHIGPATPNDGIDDFAMLASSKSISATPATPKTKAVTERSNHQ